MQYNWIQYNIMQCNAIQWNTKQCHAWGLFGPLGQSVRFVRQLDNRIEFRMFCFLSCLAAYKCYVYNINLRAFTFTTNLSAVVTSCVTLLLITLFNVWCWLISLQQWKEQLCSLSVLVLLGTLGEWCKQFSKVVPSMLKVQMDSRPCWLQLITITRTFVASCLQVADFPAVLFNILPAVLSWAMN